MNSKTRVTFSIAAIAAVIVLFASGSLVTYHQASAAAAAVYGHYGGHYRVHYYHGHYRGHYYHGHYRGHYRGHY